MTPSLALLLITAAAPLPRDSRVEVAFRELGLPAPPGERKNLADEYLPDDVTPDEIARQPDRFPIRAAVLDAVRVLRAVRDFNARPVRTECLTKLDPANPFPATACASYRCPPIRPDDTGGPRHLFRELRERVAGHILDLEDARRRLARITAEQRAGESRRWLAHADLLVVEVEFELCRSAERAAALGAGQVARGGGAGWVLVASDRPVKDEGKRRAVVEKLAATVRTAYPDTPWAAAADRFAAAPLGVVWAVVPEPAPPPRILFTPQVPPGFPKCLPRS